MNTSLNHARLPFGKSLLALSMAGLMAAPVAAQNGASASANPSVQSQGATQNQGSSMNESSSIDQGSRMGQANRLNQNGQSQSATLSQGTDQQSQANGAQEFQSMDADRDNVLVWREIYVVMDPRLVAANLDQEQVFSQYDSDNDDALNQQEFDEFLSGLEQSEIASARTQSSQGVAGGTSNQQNAAQSQQSLRMSGQDAGQQTMGQNQQQNAQAQANLEVNDNSENGADQAVVLPDDGRYSQPGTASRSAGINPQQQNDPALTTQTRYRAGQGGEMGTDESILGQGDDFAPEGETRSAEAGTNATDVSVSTLDTGATPGARSQDGMQAESNVNAAADSQAQRQAGAQQLQTVSIESLQKKTVKNSAGEELGEVKNVVVNKERGEVGLVVTSGGVMGIGSKKLLAPADQLSLSENELVWDTDKSSKELKQSAKYQSEGFTEVSDQYETIEEIRQAGL